MARQKEFESEETLEKALDIFWRNGYNFTSFQLLTEGMCVNRQSIYDTYGDKHTLYIKALTHYSKKQNDLTAQHFARPEPVPQLLREYFKKVVEATHSDEQSKGCFMINSSLEMIPHDEEVKQLVLQNIAELTTIFKGAVARGIKNKQLTTTLSPDVAALHLVNTLHGIKTMGKAVTDKKKLQQIADVALSVL